MHGNTSLNLLTEQSLTYGVQIASDFLADMNLPAYVSLDKKFQPFCSFCDSKTEKVDYRKYLIIC